MSFWTPYYKAKSYIFLLFLLLFYGLIMRLIWTAPASTWSAKTHRLKQRKPYFYSADVFRRPLGKPNFPDGASTICRKFSTDGQIVSFRPSVGLWALYVANYMPPDTPFSGAHPIFSGAHPILVHPLFEKGVH